MYITGMKALQERAYGVVSGMKMEWRKNQNQEEKQDNNNDDDNDDNDEKEREEEHLRGRWWSVEAKVG